MIEERALPALVPARTEVELWLDQLRGISSWVREHRGSDGLLDGVVSREARLDLARSQEVVERQRQALAEWAGRALGGGCDALHTQAQRRAVVAHRNEWFKGKVTDGLEAGGITVVADLENGAEAIGVVVAEQPDLLLIEDRLPMLTGLAVVDVVKRYAPSTVVVVQVEQDGQIGPFLDAGATTAYTRRIPPLDIVSELLEWFGAGCS